VTARTAAMTGQVRGQVLDYLREIALDGTDVPHPLGT